MFQQETICNAIGRLLREAGAQEHENLSKRWAREDLMPLSPLRLNHSWNALLKGLQTFILPPEVVPLCLQRRPFEQYSEDMIQHIAVAALSEPARCGRLTDAVRRFLGFRRVLPVRSTVAEAHIDLTATDPQLTNALLRIGFEPDNFAKIEPPQYKHHFTLQYVSARESPGGGERYREVHEASKRASALIDQHPSAFGYVETEHYDDDYCQRYAYSPMAAENVSHFPFDATTFVSQPVPATEKEAKALGVPLDSKRAADLHVKIPSHLNCDQHEDLDSNASRQLKLLLKQCGFYEIVSEGANFIYSAHFADMAESKTAFQQLDAFAKTYGGITGIAREVCTRMWRKPEMINGEFALAEVPPHLSYSKIAIPST